MTRPQRMAPFPAMLGSKCILDDRAQRVACVRWNRWQPMPGDPVLSSDVRAMAREHFTVKVGIHTNGWWRLIAMTTTNIVAYACIMLPSYWVYMQLLAPRAMPSMLVPGVAPVSSGPSVGGGIGLLLAWFLYIVVVGTLTSLPMTRWYWCPVIVKGVLLVRHCATCGYSLASVPPEPDGCTICPECGAAWKLPTLPAPT